MISICRYCAAAAAMAALLAFAGCASTRSNPSRAFYKTVPKTLEASISSEMQALSRKHPLPVRERDSLAQAIKQMNIKRPWLGLPLQTRVRKLDAAALPVLADLTSSSDQGTRLRAFAALTWLLKGWNLPDPPGYAETKRPALLLVRRSVEADSSPAVRMECLRLLDWVGWGERNVHGKPVQPVSPEVKAAAQAALDDPDPTIAKGARKVCQDLGLLPKPQGEAIP